MLISCVVYENGRKLADIPKEEIHLHLDKPNRFVCLLSDKGKVVLTFFTEQ